MTPQETAVKTVADQRAGKYLAFHLGREEFAIQVMKVREIIGVQDITVVPSTPGYLRGVINLRGKVIPVVDLRMRFGLREIDYTHRTCIIVINVDGETGPILMGVVVDGVSEVLTMTGADIEDTPDFGNGVAPPFLLGVAKIKDKVKILLDIDKVLRSQDIQRLESVLS